jgi:hypothetical protein
MTTILIANRLIELCKKGEFIAAQKELYDAAIVNTEVDGTQTTGLTNILAKEQNFLDSLEKIHRIDFSEPLVAGNYFSAKLAMDIEIRGIGRKSFEEIGVYQVLNNKIIAEQFFRG